MKSRSFSMKKILELQNITAGYDGKTVLSDVDLSVHENDFIGIIGPNGGGKTTLLKVIVQLLKPFSGKLLFENGFTPYDIGYLPQRSKNDMNFPITVAEVIASGMMSGKFRKGFFIKKERTAVQEITAEMGIEHLTHKTIDALSGGEFQKVMLCRSIIANPKLLILDEPNTFVDHNFETEMYHLLQELNQRMAIIMVSHDLGSISGAVKTIACVNKTLTYHDESEISKDILRAYDCPVELIAHGDVPHRVLKTHDK